MIELSIELYLIVKQLMFKHLVVCQIETIPSKGRGCRISTNFFYMTALQVGVNFFRFLKLFSRGV